MGVRAPYLCAAARSGPLWNMRCGRVAVIVQAPGIRRTRPDRCSTWNTASRTRRRGRRRMPIKPDHPKRPSFFESIASVHGGNPLGAQVSSLASIDAGRRGTGNGRRGAKTADGLRAGFRRARILAPTGGSHPVSAARRSRHEERSPVRERQDRGPWSRLRGRPRTCRHLIPDNPAPLPAVRFQYLQRRSAGKRSLLHKRKL
jgi:hypothetical protein